MKKILLDCQCAVCQFDVCGKFLPGTYFSVKQNVMSQLITLTRRESEIKGVCCYL